MKLGAYEFAPRTDNPPYGLSYAPEGCKQMSGNRIRLILTQDSVGQWHSAGVLGPTLGWGTFTFDIACRLDALDPRVVCAGWLYNDQTMDELDFLEGTRWGDPNNPQNLYLTAYKEGTKVQQSAFPARAFNRYRVQSQVLPKSVSTRILGLQPDQTWKEVATMSLGIQVPAFGQLRLGMWLPKSGLLYTKDSLARGPLWATFEQLTWVQATPEQLSA